MPRWIVSTTLAALSFGATARMFGAIPGHPEQEPHELERDDDEQEDADDREVCSGPYPTGRERQQKRANPAAPEVREPDP